MAHYNKGANAERELQAKFYSAGFSVARVAGSGSASTPCPDLLAMKGKKKYAFECKAKRGDYLNVPVEQFESTAQWAKNAGLKFFVAWKIHRQGWRFLEEKQFRQNKAHYSLTLTQAMEKGKTFEGLV